MRFGRKLIHLESVDSTNNYVANMVKDQGLASGTVIMADDQFAGKGQREAEWLSTAGMNLTLSIYIDDVNLSVDRQFKITQLVALGIHEFLSKNGINSRIKWPNDSMVDGVKIGGILIENHLSGKQIKSSIIGIGLNVNQLDFGDLAATSMSKLTNKSYLLNELYFSLIYTMNAVWERFWSDPSLDRVYLNALFRVNEKANYSDKHGDFIGEICGISPEGKIKIRKSEGVLEYSLKEVKFC